MSYTSKGQSILDNWDLKWTETFDHIKNGNERIKIIYSSFNTNTELIKLIDTSVIVRKYQDALFLEKIHYKLENGDSIKWQHQINRYNKTSQLVEEIDSVDGLIQEHKINFYKNTELRRTEYLSIRPDYNDQMEIVDVDTVQLEILKYYDEKGKCNRIVTLNKSKLKGRNKIDTTVTYNKFDLKNRLIGAINIQENDTISTTKFQYDELGREIKQTHSSLHGSNSFEYEYDKQGNVISELIEVGKYTTLILTEFDDQNQPVIRKTFRPKTIGNITYE
ncbi:hypothetical protein QYS49_11335 [Marivirga salinae]|uniref:Uncharacterized protein n=1 Tax=Marivirga salinarum TaxID=3059078 RepID=A0AA49J9P8_9BACT|nr:hypothetical protein [Marivirga sp. BDSF4-3]WKK77633.2 hypothetical protein QYS49_11335 [Marivirga sp. BDSF4-3]